MDRRNDGSLAQRATDDGCAAAHGDTDDRDADEAGSEDDVELREVAERVTGDAVDLEHLPNGLMLPRRRFLRLGAAAVGMAAAAVAADAVAPGLRQRGLWTPDGAFDAASIAWADLIYTEAFPTSPLILSPFTDELPIPRPLAPVAWDDCQQWSRPPGPDTDMQSAYGGTHQIWPTAAGMPLPIVYNIKLQVAEHSFTTSKVRSITKGGKNAVSYDAAGNTYRAGVSRSLPASTIYGFNGTFPGPMINAEYGRPVLVRFENELHLNPRGLDRQDFGAPDASFLTHLHNAHTAPESDGNPFSTMREFGHHGYETGTYCDNLYLNWPAGGDNSEKQSFFWFHDHRMDHTGANVYKGMVGLYPIYDRMNGGIDPGDERLGLHLPGVPNENTAPGTFRVDYDVPLAFYDCRLDDGVTIHQDIHDGMGEYPNAGNPRKHPEWWGKTFFKHFANHGFVGDIFTVNGTAFPVMEVKRRKYRFRFLDASVARIYEFKLMSSTKGPKSAVSLGYKDGDLQGQYRLTDAQQCMRFTQIAADGGLLPAPIVRDSFELWPAKRREMVIDFTTYLDGSPTSAGDVVYLCNVMKMTDGRMWSNSSRSAPDAKYVVPVLKFVLGDLAEDNSEIPPVMRPLPPLPTNWRDLLRERMIFELDRGAVAGETEWLINDQPFDPTTPARSLKNPANKTPLAQQRRGSFNIWEIRNGGGGWVHPMHLHMEEHRVVMRNGVDVTERPRATHPDDGAREDVIALDPGESVMVYRGFRTFTGPYVAHCHNLAHEDHAMMFGWEITP